MGFARVHLFLKCLPPGALCALEPSVPCPLSTGHSLSLRLSCDPGTPSSQECPCGSQRLQSQSAPTRLCASVAREASPLQRQSQEARRPAASPSVQPTGHRAPRGSPEKHKHPGARPAPAPPVPTVPRGQAWHRPSGIHRPERCHRVSGLKDVRSSEGPGARAGGPGTAPAPHLPRWAPAPSPAGPLQPVGPWAETPRAGRGLARARG